ncbi:hypothetical protein Tco_1432625 [Tanacetum coccineum]
MKNIQLWLQDLVRVIVLQDLVRVKSYKEQKDFGIKILLKISGGSCITLETQRENKSEILCCSLSVLSLEMLLEMRSLGIRLGFESCGVVGGD